MGVYMGIFNMFIVIPQIVAATLLGPTLKAVFDNQPIYSTVVEYAKQVPANNTGVYYYEARDAVSAALTKVIGGGDMAASLAEAQSTVEFAMN